MRDSALWGLEALDLFGPKRLFEEIYELVCSLGTQIESDAAHTFGERFSGGVRGDIPLIAGQITDISLTIPIIHICWLFQRNCTGLYCALIGGVGIGDIEMERGGHHLRSF